MPPLWLLLMPWSILKEQEEEIWCRRDLPMGGELELGCPPPRVQLEKVGR